MKRHLNITRSMLMHIVFGGLALIALAPVSLLGWVTHRLTVYLVIVLLQNNVRSHMSEVADGIRQLIAEVRQDDAKLRLMKTFSLFSRSFWSRARPALTAIVSALAAIMLFIAPAVIATSLTKIILL